MNSSIQKKERKIVPRFRRKNIKKNLVDIDDEEAQELIEKDLKSEFIWKSDTNEDFKYQVDDSHYEENSQQISLFDDNDNSNLVYDIENKTEQLWKTTIGQDESKSIQWIDEQQSYEISFSLKSSQDNKQNWTLNDNNQYIIQFNLVNQNSQQYQYDLDKNYENLVKHFIKGDEFRNKAKLDIECDNQEINLFIKDNDDLSLISFDLNIPSINLSLSLPQNPILFNWLEGITQYNISLPSENLSEQFSPISEYKLEIDSNNLKSLKWSLDILKENLIYSYLISLADNENLKYSLDDNKYDLKFSINDENFKQLFSLTDFSFQQILSLSSNDLKKQLLSIVDSIEIKQNFGKDDHYKLNNFSLENLKTIIINYSPIEILNLIYSPNDAKEILLENLLIESDEISARALRRYRCKHMSIKIDENNQLDHLEKMQLIFHGNESIAIGEKFIYNDLNEQQIFRDVANNKILLESVINQSYDINLKENLSNNLGPCLYRSDYECQPPKTWSNLRREIGYISYDASLSQPIYYLNKSYKRFIHVPLKRDNCSYNVYHGYKEFIDKVRLNPENYFRRFDSTDLRPLLYWYSQKQHLFSLNNKNMLKPPTFICRRLVLRTILANLYCDSEPWKLLVIRMKGQFYLALANQKTKSVEDMTEDEYGGYKFEDLFTTDQPNTTRFQENIPLENPQKQFHTVQYWQFGDFNLLYTNEIDGEIKNNIQENLSTNDDHTKQEENLTSKTPPTENSQKSNDIDSWGSEISMNSENIPEEIEETLKEIQINENLQISTNNENEIVEKKKVHENELKAGYVEMKCTNKKIFYRDENKLRALTWWAQMWLANINTLMIGYKTANDGFVNQIDLLSIDKLIWKFLSKYNLHLKYCLSYLYSFLNLIEKTVVIDDPNTIHAFAYIPQPLETDPLTGKPYEYDLPKYVPFRYTQMKRSSQRHSNLMPQWYIEFIQRTIPLGGILQDNQLKTIEQEMKQRIGHRGRASCILKQEQKKKKKKYQK